MFLKKVTAAYRRPTEIVSYSSHVFNKEVTNSLLNDKEEGCHYSVQTFDSIICKGGG